MDEQTDRHMDIGHIILLGRLVKRNQCDQQCPEIDYENGISTWQPWHQF